jgi:hypothetical protein
MDQDMTCSFEHTENRYLVEDGSGERDGPHLRAVSVNWKVAEAGIPTVKREPLSGKSGCLENDKQSGTAEKIQNLRL